MSAEAPTGPGSAPGDPHSELEALLAQCLEREGLARVEAIEEACRRRPDLADELRAQMLWLEQSGLAREERDDAQFPARISGFQLLKRLGGGGMGVVHLALEESLGRKVALKTVRPESLWFSGARERFRREIGTVAQLRHPAILPIYSVGEIGGVPWFTMEWIEGCTVAELIEAVRGRPVEELQGRDGARALADRAGAALDESALPPGYAGDWIHACLSIAAAVADAIVHAHAAKILHRDLKPSNIMLSRDGRVLLLDFGLAVSAEADPLTRSGAQLGSAPYMSPEQVRGQTLDERTDVYSLGATLYEMLALRRPFAAAETALLWQQVLAGDSQPLRRFNRRVAWDVDTVCRTAMEVDRERRYRSMAEFRDDLQRLLAREPIRARPPGPLLRARRFVERHPTLTAITTLLLIAAAGIPTAFFLRERDARAAIEREAAIADETTRLLEDVFLSASPTSGLGAETPVRALLEAGAAEIEQRLGERPDLRGRLLGVLGRAYATLGDDARAEPLLLEAIELHRASDDRDEADLALLRVHLAESVWRLSRFDEAEQRIEELLAQRNPPVDRHWTVHLLADRGRLREQRGRTLDAERDLREAVALAENPDVHGNARARAAECLASFLVQRGDERGALPWFEKARDEYGSVQRPDHPRVLEADLDLARCLARLGSTDRAKALAYEALARMERLYPREGLMLITPLRQTAEVTLLGGDPGRGEQLLRRAVAIADSHLPPDHPLRAWSHHDLGYELMRAGRYAEAAQELELALEGARLRPGDSPAFLATVLGNGANALASSGRAKEALSYAEESVALVRDFDPPNRSALAGALRTKAWADFVLGDLRASERDAREAVEMLEGVAQGLTAHSVLVESLTHLALVANRLGKPAEGKRWAERALEATRATGANEARLAANAEYMLGWSHVMLREVDPANLHLRKSIELYDQAFQEGHPLEAFPLDQLGALLVEDRPDEALPFFRRAYDIRKRFLAPEDDWLAVSRNNLAVALGSTDHESEALELWQENVDALRRRGRRPDQTLAAGLMYLARAQQERGDARSAADLARESLAHLVQLYPAEHAVLASMRRLLGSSLLALDEPAQALAPLEDAWNDYAKSRDPSDSLARQCAQDFEQACERTGDGERAAELARWLGSTGR